jgi:hypothetical protein
VLADAAPSEELDGVSAAAPSGAPALPGCCTAAPETGDPAPERTTYVSVDVGDIAVSVGVWPGAGALRPVATLGAGAVAEAKTGVATLVVIGVLVVTTAAVETVATDTVCGATTTVSDGASTVCSSTTVVVEDCTSAGAGDAIEVWEAP